MSTIVKMLIALLHINHLRNHEHFQAAYRDCGGSVGRPPRLLKKLAYLVIP